MAIDATFWVAVSFVIFFGGLIYLKIPQKITEMLDKMISDIKNEIDESEKLRTEAKTLLDNAQKKLDTAQNVKNEILEQAKKDDPFPKLEKLLIDNNFQESKLNEIKKEIDKEIVEEFKKAMEAADPEPEDLFKYKFSTTDINKEVGKRSPEKNDSIFMVDAGICAIKELMEDHQECLLYGQDVGKRLGGVFREAATLGEHFGDERVFNTPIQEAFIIGSTVGMSAVGLKPIVEIQFADYIWPGLKQQ